MVLERRVNVGLTVNRRICVFCRPKVRYLGVLVKPRRHEARP